MNMSSQARLLLSLFLLVLTPLVQAQSKNASPANEVLLYPSDDATLSRLNLEGVQGGDRQLGIRPWAQGQRALIRFDLAALGINGSDIHSARLVFQLDGNDDDWPNNGIATEVAVHSVNAPWSENSVSWSCASAGFCGWSGGVFNARETDRASLRHAEHGVMQFDVTHDVVRFLNGQDNHGWLLKKRREDLAGGLAFSSKEGRFRPRLILTLSRDLDLVLPMLQIVSPASAEVSAGGFPGIVLSYSDDRAIDQNSLQVVLDGGVLSSCATSANSATCLADLAPGAHLLVVSVSDFRGNTARAQRSFVYTAPGTGGGSPGEAGPQGEAGPMGPQGETGAAGPQGETGPVGPQGEAGAVGPQGIPGAPGADGGMGPVGPQGETGLQGAKGDPGEPGPANNVFAGIINLDSPEQSYLPLGWGLTEYADGQFSLRHALNTTALSFVATLQHASGISTDRVVIGQVTAQDVFFNHVSGAGALVLGKVSGEAAQFMLVVHANMNPASEPPSLPSDPAPVDPVPPPPAIPPQVADGLTCKDILARNPQAASGVYTVNPDGDGPELPFQAYCDMTHEGGGWMLYGRHGDAIDTIKVLEVVTPSVFGVVHAQRWSVMRGAMQDGMMFMDEFGKISTMSATKLMAGNCKTPWTVTDLSLPAPGGSRAGKIWHDETADCNVLNNDYSLINMEGSESNLTQEARASLYQFSKAKFDKWPYSTNSSRLSHTELMYFVR